MKERLQESGDRRLTHPAQAQGSHGDTKLAGGKIRLQVVLNGKG